MRYISSPSTAGSSASGCCRLAEVTALEFTTPAWAALLAALFLGERIGGHRAVAVTMGLIGVLIILRPGIEVIDLGALVISGATSYLARREASATRRPEES